MKVFNPSRFCVEIGGRLTYNNKAVEWMNNDLKNHNKQLWPTTEDLNKKESTVLFYEVIKFLKDVLFSKDAFVKLEVVHNDNKYTGLSGIISSKYCADIWFLNLNGTFLDYCPYPLFLKVKK
jgi:hypothetical protein